MSTRVTVNGEEMIYEHWVRRASTNMLRYTLKNADMTDNIEVIVKELKRRSEEKILTK